MGIQDEDKYITIIGNETNGEDEDFDVPYDNLEIWDDGDESITIFLTNK